ncbi:hypothetical protein GOP47_0010704 [Adiantum capillus-veneris]|uniref:Protein TPX2 n=1 Tax=Adiantum capillus-veneris TaxID=13818 RepID=A0A9D4UVF6_ADICA|nr:hypothetical protein GOP47_0010704 [Adiantum capillus-veneris]
MVAMPSPAIFQFDPDFEFSAPHFYDFTAPESVAQLAEAESWFETSASHGASPFSVHSRDHNMTPEKFKNECYWEQMDASKLPANSKKDLRNCPSDARGIDLGLTDDHKDTEGCTSRDFELSLRTPSEAHKCRALSVSRMQTLTSPNSLPVKRDHTEMSKRAPFTDKPATKPGKSYLLRTTQNHDMQAIKKQKLEGGRLKQITSTNDGKCNVRTPANLTVPKAFNFLTEKRLISARKDNILASQVGKASSPFISMAEKVQRFEMKTRDVFHNPVPHKDDSGSRVQEKSKLKLTRPKEPEFETSQRIRPARVKSTAELEAELLAKMPKFKARPLNKKILEAPSLPSLPKSTPSMPEFQEFHLRTMERALQQASSASLASVSSADSSTFEECRNRRKSAPGAGYTELREPRLQTAARARPAKVKSSEEREQEELAKIPKFKARPLDKKIFWSRGDLGIFRNTKRQVTTPVEFRFATEERVNNQPQTQTALDLFSKLSINPQNENQPPKLTKPEPFHLLTEDRGQKKVDQMLIELKDNQLRELEQRIPKANPLPFTTDYPEVPPKPDPKECTIPQPFYLESVARHRQEMIKRADENRRIEKEEMDHRKFHAQPILCNGSVFVPERSRKPLTEVQEFAFQVDTRALERAEFDRKVAEKQNCYKRFREEYEATKRADEERLIKSMRRTMVPQALPLPIFEKPFIPKRCSKELTRPRSPKLSVTHRRERRSSLTFRRQSSTFSIQKRLQMR